MFLKTFYCLLFIYLLHLMNFCLRLRVTHPISSVLKVFLIHILCTALIHVLFEIWIQYLYRWDTWYFSPVLQRLEIKINEIYPDDTISSINKSEHLSFPTSILQFFTPFQIIIFVEVLRKRNCLIDYFIVAEKSFPAEQFR